MTHLSLKILSVALLLVVGGMSPLTNALKAQTMQTEKRYHTIQKGETLYALTKLYGVTAEEICAANPGLSATNFQIGAVILVPPTSQPEPVKAKPDTIEQKVGKGLAGSDCREMYKVKKKDTLFGIAQTFGVTLEELQRANPETNKPDFQLKKKMVLCIPYHKEAPPKPKEPTNEELFQKVRGNAQGLSTIRVGVILPLKEKSSNRSRMIDYYRGLLMAIDSLKHTGLSFEVYTYNVGSSATDVNAILQKPVFPLLDIIFGPANPAQIEKVSQFSKKNKIPLVVPFYSKSEEIKENPYYFAPYAPDSVQYSEVKALVGHLFKKSNLLIVETGQTTSDFIINLKSCFENVRYAQFPITQKALISHLDSKNVNLIVLSSAELKSLNVFMPVLRDAMKAHPEMIIKLIGYPDWLSYTSRMLEDFYAADTYIYSPFFLNYASVDYRKLCNHFHHNFNTEMLSVTPRIGVYGFDSGMFFLKGLSRYGKAFGGEDTGVQTIQNKFRFQRVSNWGGLVNRQMQFVHYSNDQIELVEKNQP